MIPLFDLLNDHDLNPVPPHENAAQNLILLEQLVPLVQDIDIIFCPHGSKTQIATYSSC
jgi:hypothetical protein